MADLTSQALRAATVAALVAAGVAVGGGGVVSSRSTPWPDDDEYPQVSVYTMGGSDRPIGKTSRSFDRAERLAIDGAVQYMGGLDGPDADEALAAAMDALGDEILQALWGSSTWPPANVYEWREIGTQKSQDAGHNRRRGMVSIAIELVHRRTFRPTEPTVDLERVVVDLDMSAPGGLLDADGNQIPDGKIDAGVVIDDLEG